MFSCAKFWPTGWRLKTGGVGVPGRGAGNPRGLLLKHFPAPRSAAAQHLLAGGTRPTHQAPLASLPQRTPPQPHPCIWVSHIQGPWGSDAAAHLQWSHRGVCLPSRVLGPLSRHLLGPPNPDPFDSTSAPAPKPQSVASPVSGTCRHHQVVRGCWAALTWRERCPCASERVAGSRREAPGGGDSHRPAALLTSHDRPW